jgi:hypothetical protein
MDPEIATEGEVIDEESSHDESPRLVPVTAARKYRKRAQAAEKRLEEVHVELAEKETLLSMHARDMADLNRSREIDERLLEAETVDLEAARLLTVQALEAMDEPDVEKTISELRRRKPYLFQRRVRSTGTQSPHRLNGEAHHDTALGQAAHEAGTTGRRANLLRYLRLRRVGA